MFHLVIIIIKFILFTQAQLLYYCTQLVNINLFFSELTLLGTLIFETCGIHYLFGSSVQLCTVILFSNLCPNFSSSQRLTLPTHLATLISLTSFIILYWLIILKTTGILFFFGFIKLFVNLILIVMNTIAFLLNITG